MSETLNLKSFDIGKICDSGQCFRMRELEDGSYEVITNYGCLHVLQKGESVTFDCSKEDISAYWAHYFDFDTDYDKVIKSVDKKDLFLTNACKFGEGVRILNQDLFEMIITFIISQRNNIKRIRKSVSLLCEKYGEKRIGKNGNVYYTFPSAEALSKADVADLRSIGLGYRDAYVKKAAEAVYLKETDLSFIETLSYEAAKEELLKLHGVGEKVADCICLFALHKTEAFPKDTHINQVIEREYKDGFPFNKYKEVAGILQQYIFYYEINK